MEGGGGGVEYLCVGLGRKERGIPLWGGGGLVVGYVGEGREV